MCDKKYLLLVNGRWSIHRFFIKNVNIEHIKVTSIYKMYKKNLKYKIAALWMEKCKLPFEDLWYEKWKNEVGQYDTIIVSALNLSWQVLFYIKRKNPNCRIIVWYWDTVDEKKRLPERCKEFCEVWSFDEEDCKKYRMKLNGQFYLPLNISDKDIVYDVLFVGRDKGRIEQLNLICDLLKKNGMKIYTYVQRNEVRKMNLCENTEKEIEYEEVVDLVVKSKCIIDIPKKGQSGITMRVLESIFYSKKLITTDYNIKKYEFYNSNNIFIWGEDNLENVVTFINGEFQPISENIKKKYLFEEWMKRFEYEEEQLLFKNI